MNPTTTETTTTETTSFTENRILDIVFEGGGARGLALNGAVAALHSHGTKFHRLVGTSAGAICATVVAAGYEGQDLLDLALQTLPDGKSVMTAFAGPPDKMTDQELLNSSLGALLRKIDIPLIPERWEQQFDLLFMKALLQVPGVPNLFSVVERGGYFGAEGFLEWLAGVLDAGGRNMSKLTFAEMYQKTGYHLTMITSDIDKESIVVLNHITTPNCPILMGVRMSMSIPFFWPSVAWDPAWGTYDGATVNGHAMVDGGVTSNFALRLLVSDEPWVQEVMGGPPDPTSEVLGLYLDGKIPVPNAPPAPEKVSLLGAFDDHSKILTRAENVMDTMMSANDLAESRAYPSLVCHLPVQGYGTVEFDMSQERIEALLRGGSMAMEAWLHARGAFTKVEDAQNSSLIPDT